MLDADYRVVNLPEVVKLEDNINGSQQASLLRLLTKYDTLSYGTLGDWKIAHVKLESQV